MGVSIHDFEDWRSQQTSFEDIAAYYAETVNVGGTEGEPIRYLGAYASARMFEILRVQPVLGRVFRPEEDHPSTPPVMLLSYRAWQDRFQGDPNIVGRTVRANAEMTTIVGVMPETVRVPAADGRVAAAAHRPRWRSRAAAGRRSKARSSRPWPGSSPASRWKPRRPRWRPSPPGWPTTYPGVEPGDRRHGAAADGHVHRAAGPGDALHDARPRCSACC